MKNNKYANVKVQNVVVLIIMIILMLGVTAIVGVLDDFIGGIAGSLVIIIGKELLLQTE